MSKYNIPHLHDQHARRICRAWQKDNGFNLLRSIVLSFGVFCTTVAHAANPSIFINEQPRSLLENVEGSNPALTGANCLAWNATIGNGIGIHCDNSQQQPIGSILCNGNDLSAGCGKAQLIVPADAIPIEELFLANFNQIQADGITEDMARLLQILAAIPTSQGDNDPVTRQVAYASMQQLRGSVLFLQLRDNVLSLPTDALREVVCNHWLILFPQAITQTQDIGFDRATQWDILSGTCTQTLRNPESFGYRLTLLGSGSSDFNSVGLILTEQEDPHFPDSICPFTDVCLSPFKPGCAVKNLAVVSASAAVQTLEAAHAAQVIGQQNPLIGYFNQTFICDTPTLKPLINAPFQCVPLAQAADRWYQAVFALNQLAPNVLLPNFQWQLDSPFSADTIAFVQVLSEQLLEEGSAENMQRWIEQKTADFSNLNIPNEISTSATEALTNLSQALLWLTDQPAPTLFPAEQSCFCHPLTEQDLLATCHPSYNSPTLNTSPSNRPQPQLSPGLNPAPNPNGPRRSPTVPETPTASPTTPTASPTTTPTASPATPTASPATPTASPATPTASPVAPSASPVVPINSPQVSPNAPDQSPSPTRSPTAASPAPIPGNSPTVNSSPAPTPSSPSLRRSPVVRSPSQGPNPAPVLRSPSSATGPSPALTRSPAPTQLRSPISRAPAPRGARSPS